MDGQGSRQGRIGRRSRPSTLWIGAFGTAALACLVAAGCGSGGAVAPARPAVPDSEPPAAPVGALDGERAFAHLEALVAIGPRVSGTEGADEARGYIRGVLEELGVEVQEQSVELDLTNSGETVEYKNLVGVIPGESEDIVLLAAPFDSRPYDSFEFVGANDGASGAALVLELGRQLVERPISYTVWLAFLDGESPRLPEQEALAGLTGSILMVNELDEAELQSRIRLAVYFNRVADAELRIARDLHSHRVYRDQFFFATARRLGHTEAFPPDAPFDSPPGGHRAFVRAGMRRSVAIVDDAYGGEEPPGTFANSEEDTLEHCSAESLATVGAVSEEAVRGIARRLAKIDSFVRRPIPPEPESEEAEGEDAVGELAEASGAAEDEPAEDTQAGDAAPEEPPGAEPAAEADEQGAAEPESAGPAEAADAAPAGEPDPTRPQAQE